ncbi:DUF2623 domain-containing protein [Superficieibacter electus]|uniref:DUF2623 domain-containing protein n=1 Tax=Superficieibacter electus TaxID=2022662 RepID=A0A2P5GUZ7_9ENTR|nr:DUF2623 family protein [Superficieibacter electus]POP44336.1 DUF2623 domain-containing protein [Superficieibacter electus]POP50354.1 DUF2623 domain-containing protein [Superficieibacter electus]
MTNHFGTGIVDGLNGQHPRKVADFTGFNDDYKRGYVLGYCHQLREQCGEKELAAWQAGLLTRQYHLDKNIMIEFFTEFGSDAYLHYFRQGYQECLLPPRIQPRSIPLRG